MTVYELTGDKGFEGFFKSKEEALELAKKHAVREAFARDSPGSRNIAMYYLEDFGSRGIAETWGVFRLTRWRQKLELVCSFRVFDYEAR